MVVMMHSGGGDGGVDGGGDGGGDGDGGDGGGDGNGLEPVSSNNTLTKTKIQSISMLLMCLYLCDSTVFSSNL